MSRETLLGLLSSGNNGDQILQILDAIVEELAEQNTSSPVDFWYLRGYVPILKPHTIACGPPESVQY